MNDDFDPWLSYWLNETHAGPWPCRPEWFFEPDHTASASPRLQPWGRAS